MKNVIGIRKEDKDLSERRAPLSPAQVKRLIDKHGIEVHLEQSETRVFRNDEYKNAGAVLESELTGCNIIFGVKEVPVKRIQPNQSYCFFSHTIKGQSHNMEMLKHILQVKATLFDYERIINDEGKRLIFFSRFAGCAGMINTIWALGQRLLWEGYDSPFAKVKRAYKYDSLAEAKEEIKLIGNMILEKGFKADFLPLVVGIAGYGNVSLGAQEIFNLLPHTSIKPSELKEVINSKGQKQHQLYKVIFKEEDLVQPKSPRQIFDLSDYYTHPQNYKSVFEDYLQHLTILVNAIYWEPKYPRLVTKIFLKEYYKKDTKPKLKVIGDITCDINGSVECTIEATTVDNPVYVYDPVTQKIQYGVEGTGPVVLALDRLPNEFAKESTDAFGNALLPFIPALAKADYTKTFERLDIPKEFKRAAITYDGHLTPDYISLNDFIK